MGRTVAGRGSIPAVLYEDGCPRPKVGRVGLGNASRDVELDVRRGGPEGDDLFGDAGRRCAHPTRRRGRRRTYGKGQFIFYQGDSGDTLLVVCRGLVKVVFTSEAGEETVLVTLGDGEVARGDRAPGRGGALGVGRRRRADDGPARTRTTVLDVMVRHPAVLDAMMRSLGRLVNGLTEQAGDFAFLDLGGRLAKLLLRLAGDRPKQRTASCWTSASPSPTSPRWSARAVRR